jgi:hypothetical protein
MTGFAKRMIAACGLLLTAAYCFLGALQNGSFAVAGAAEPSVFHRNARIWFALAVVALAGAVFSVFQGVRLRCLPTLRDLRPSRASRVACTLTPRAA